MNTNYIASITSPSIDPSAAATAAMAAMREAAIALIVANTAIARRTTPEEVENVFFPIAEEFCSSSDIIVIRRSTNTKKDTAKEFHFSSCPTADIAVMAKLIEVLGEIYVEDKLGYDYNNSNYVGFCYHNSAGEFCALLHSC